MPVNEFDLINEYFKRVRSDTGEVLVGIGDDAAVIRTNNKNDLVVSIDTIVADVHFPLSTSPYDIGWKALAVNLSDMAAMAAQPAWFTLALTLPESSRHWLEAFSHGLFSLADQFNLPLVGGDTTRGPLSITIQIAGNVAKDKALLRSGAKSGDDIYVSGTLGDAALALAMLQSGQTTERIAAGLLSRLNRPEPRVKLGMALAEVAHCAIDISDGLLADLQHMLNTASLGAVIDSRLLPKSSAFVNMSHSADEYLDMQLNGGDDYELCFCAPPENKKEIAMVASECGIPLTRIGKVSASDTICDSEGKELNLDHPGYQHF
jgi:thiamine-monophosphate kinase